MIVSRTLAKQRIASGTRPGFGAAWLLVMVDGILIIGLLLLIWQGVAAVVDLRELPITAAIGLVFVVFYMPSQAVLIVSSMWAARSRWKEKEETDEQQ